jgi:predicted ArsR family transcriptional regulator
MSDLGQLPVYEWDDPKKYELLAWVKASERRVDILTALAESPKNTNDFADEWGTTLEAVRYHLNLLSSEGPGGEYTALIDVLTPKRHQYKLYGLTDAGAEAVESL